MTPEQLLTRFAELDVPGEVPDIIADALQTDNVDIGRMAFICGALMLMDYGITDEIMRGMVHELGRIAPLNRAAMQVLAETPTATDTARKAHDATGNFSDALLSLYRFTQKAPE